MYVVNTFPEIKRSNVFLKVTLGLGRLISGNGSSNNSNKNILSKSHEIEQIEDDNRDISPNTSPKFGTKDEENMEIIGNDNSYLKDKKHSSGRLIKIDLIEDKIKIKISHKPIIYFQKLNTYEEGCDNPYKRLTETSLLTHKEAIFKNNDINSVIEESLVKSLEINTLIFTYRAKSLLNKREISKKINEYYSFERIILNRLIKIKPHIIKSHYMESDSFKFKEQKKNFKTTTIINHMKTKYKSTTQVMHFTTSGIENSQNSKFKKSMKGIPPYDSSFSFRKLSERFNDNIIEHDKMFYNKIKKDYFDIFKICEIIPPDITYTIKEVPLVINSIQQFIDSIIDNKDKEVNLMNEVKEFIKA